MNCKGAKARGTPKETIIKSNIYNDITGEALQ
jgi:hypothetical protein